MKLAGTRKSWRRGKKQEKGEGKRKGKKKRMGKGQRRGSFQDIVVHIQETVQPGRHCENISQENKPDEKTKTLN